VGGACRRRLRSSIPHSLDHVVGLPIERYGFAPMVASLTSRAGETTGILRLDYGVNWIGELEDKHYGRQIEAYRNPKRNGQNRKTEKQKRKEATRLAALLGGEWGQLVGDIEVC
jgi:hypothetical protein